MSTSIQLFASSAHLDMNVGGKNPTAKYSTDASPPADERNSQRERTQSETSITGQDPAVVKRVLSDPAAIRKIVELQVRQPD